ncbi:hypothetical protein LEP1GSC077_0921 [Leptospira interrogans str. C10069]|nr:hypothetical protein LEP1GSC077_0921 [Leptospira interrogans str. C10069]EMN61904.1 hypothetical protein LEP1GSC092_2513 [Leptospira interrogans serovar Pyrogenes str. R168]
MNSTERAFYGSPFWAQKGTFFNCSNKNEFFYLQKVCFSDKENLSHPKIGKTQHNTFLKLNASLCRSRWKTQHNAFLKLNASLPKGRSAGRVEKLNTTLSSNSMHRSLRVALQVALKNSTQRFPMGRVVGRELSFTEDFVVIPTIDLEIQLFVE